MKPIHFSLFFMVSFGTAAFGQCDTTLFDQFTMTFDQAFEYETPLTEDNTVYILEVKGQYDYMCCFNTHDPAYRIIKSGYADVFPQMGWQWQGQSFRRPIPDVINPNSVYNYPFLGTGLTESFSFTDDDYTDNNGFLQFTISKIDNCADTNIEPVFIYDTITTYMTVDTQYIDVINNIVVTESVTVTDTLLINLTLGTTQDPIPAEVKVYPNPANDYLFINIPEFADADGYTVSIFDILGNDMEKVFITSETTLMDISSFGIGIYSLIIQNEQNQTVATKKVIIQ